MPEEYSGVQETFSVSALPRHPARDAAEARCVPRRPAPAGSRPGSGAAGRALIITSLLSLSISTAPGLGGQSPAPQDQTPTFGVRVDLVSLDLEVLDRSGEPVRGLKRQDFRIMENGKPVEITNFAWLERRSVSLVLVLDTSGLSRERLLLSKDFVSRLIHLLARADEIALYSYNEKDAFLEQDFTADRRLIIEALSNIEVPSKRRRNLLKEAFGRQPPSGLSVDLALMKAREGRNDKKAVLLISDLFRGLGPAVVEHAQEAGLTVLTVRVGENSARLVDLKAEDGRSQAVAAESGGREFRIAPEGLAGVCRSIAASLKNHYQAVYLTEIRTRDGRARKIDAAVPGRDCTVHARKSYSPSR